MRKHERLAAISVSVLAVASVVCHGTSPPPPLPIEDLIRQAGYPVEDHTFETEDGYVITYHRIPRGKGSTSPRANPVPVLVMHGLLCSSPVWVMSKQSLGFSLADTGYDVWLGNVRGNTYGRKHVQLDPDVDPTFWDFSWHEMGYYDLPAAIDYILQETGKDQLFYIGHSMGTTVYFVLGSSRPEYMAKIQAAFLMSPVSGIWHNRSILIQILLRYLSFSNSITNARDLFEVKINPIILGLGLQVCAIPSAQFICRNFIFLIVGFNENGLSRALLPKMLAYLPAGTSYKVLHHYDQLSIKGTEFQQYDYGLQKNMLKYNSPYPPVYNLSKVTAPTYIYSAANDWIAVPKDVFYVVQKLPNLRRATQVADERFNHIDFMWAVNAKSVVYDNIIATLYNLTDT